MKYVKQILTKPISRLEQPKSTKTYGWDPVKAAEQFPEY